MLVAIALLAKLFAAYVTRVGPFVRMDALVVV